MWYTKKYDPIFLLVGFIICMLAVNAVWAEGPEFAVGTPRTLTWTAPALRIDGSAITKPLTINIYTGTSGANLTLFREGVPGGAPGADAGFVGVPTLAGQNWVGIVAVEEGAMGPSPMSNTRPFWGVVPPTAAPRAAVLRAVQ